MSATATVEKPPVEKAPTTPAPAATAKAPKPVFAKPGKVAEWEDQDPAFRNSSSPVAADHYGDDVPKDAAGINARVKGFIGMLQRSPDAKIVELSLDNQPNQEVALTRYKVPDQRLIRIEFVIPR